MIAMKTFLTAIALFFSLSLCLAQTGLVSGNLNITVIPNNVGSGRFQVAGTFSDPKGQWFASDVDTGMIMWKGNNLYLIDSILSVSGPNITFRVQDIYSTGFIATGTAQVLELTENLGLPAVSTTGDSNAALATPPDHAALLNYLVAKIDSIVGNLPSGADGNGIYGGSGSLPGRVFVGVDTSNDAGITILRATRHSSPIDMLTLKDNSPPNRGVINRSMRFSFEDTSFVDRPFHITYTHDTGLGSPILRTRIGRSDDVSLILKGSEIHTQTGEDSVVYVRNNAGNVSPQEATIPGYSPNDTLGWFWERSTLLNKGGRYRLPVSTYAQNPAGGTNTIQASLDSIFQSGGADGNGIYSGSGTVITGDTTIVTVPGGSGLKVGNTLQTNEEITTIHDANHWGTYYGWDRATYSYGGFSGYYFFRGNGSAASKTALNVNDVMHEWAFIGQNSPTHENYALILKPTVDEITGGNNWGRLDFQGADFQTWLSIRRTGIRAGTAANYTTFPNARPGTNNQFWQYNIDGTGEYKTPGAMTVTNPAGGTNTLQAALDSIMNAATWLKPQLEAGDVTINSADNTLILNKESMTTDPAIHVVHPVPTIGVTRRLFSAGQTSSGYAFEITQHSNNAYKISTSQALLTLESSSLGDPTEAQLGNGEMYIINTSGPSSIKLNGTSNTVSVAASSTNAENWTLILPTTKGNSGQFLQTNGSGVTSWAAPSIPNIGGISAMYTAAGYSYTSDVLGGTVPVISLPTTVGTKVGISKVVSGAGHGIEVNFGGAALCEITGFVTIQESSGDNYYLQLYLNGSPMYSTVYAATGLAASTPKTAHISHLAEIPAGGIVTMRLHSTDSNSCTIVSAGLTVTKNQ